ncbi:MAG: NAD(P)/FAD-dependent oxidoreductase [Candidatus Competibacterales bacterium]
MLVVGGGPAGSAIATLLHRRGYRVVLVEKDTHPRFHIGESLLPLTLPILAELGVLEAVAATGIPKYGAEFGRDRGRQSIYFAEAMDKIHPMAYQVRRAEFDGLLFDNAKAQGVEVHSETKVVAVDLEEEAHAVVETVDASGRGRQWRARFVVDASGRDTLLARKLNLKRKNPRHQSAAIFGHFRGVARLPGRDAGNISIYWFPHGWMWLIPLPDAVVSVGAVCWPEYLKTRRCSLEAFLWQTIALCPAAQSRMAEARLAGEARATGNYSYRATAMYGPRHLLVGDAFAFIDPVFSSGVHLALSSAASGAAAIDGHLRHFTPKAKPLAAHARRMNRGIDTVAWFIYRFTSPAMEQLFMNPRDVLGMKAALISVLAGDVFRNTPTRVPLWLFKGVYYLTSLGLWSQAWTARRRRRNSAQIVFTGGTTPEDRSAV